MSSEWVMVIITGIYVLATIIICVFNGKSAAATAKQVDEMKREYSESQRLEIMPYLQIKKTSDIINAAENKNSIVIELMTNEQTDEMSESQNIPFIIENVGNGTATNIIFDWNCNTKTKHQIDTFPINAISKNINQYLWLNFFIGNNQNNSSLEKGILTLSYDDLLGNTYEQFFYLYFDSTTNIYFENFVKSIDNDIPRYKGKQVYSIADTSER